MEPSRLPEPHDLPAGGGAPVAGIAASGGNVASAPRAMRGWSRRGGGFRARLPALLAMLLVLNASLAQAGSTEPVITVIASPGTNGEVVPLSTLRAIFGMRLHRWPDGTPVKVFVFKDDAPEHTAFSKTVLQVFPHQLRQSWDRLVFSGLGQYPEQVATEKEMLDKVASTPGAVGYVRTGDAGQNVLTLQIR